MGKFGTPFKLEQLSPAQRADAERQLALPAGVATSKGKPPSERTKRSLAVKFEDAWEAANGPRYAVELPLDPDRRFLIDYSWPAEKIILELQGGIYMQGKGHVNPKRFRSDCDKLNLANMLGYITFKLATGQITADNIIMLRNFILSRRKNLP